MKKIFIAILALSSAVAVSAQKYLSKNTTLTFSVKGPTETIEATNKTANGAIDSKTGAIAFSVLIKGFVFDKQKMQEHFNDELGSSKYPKSEFKGTITNNSTVKYTVDGTYNVNVSGKLTLHNITKDITATGKVTVAGGKVSATSDFSVTLSDYGVSVTGVGGTAKIAVKTGTMSKVN